MEKLYCLIVIAVHVEGLVSTSDIAESREVSIYPNPVRDVLNVRVKAVSEIAKLNILDYLGRSIYERKQINEELIQIDVSAFDAGLFILEINYNDGWRASRKIIISNKLEFSGLLRLIKRYKTSVMA